MNSLKDFKLSLDSFESSLNEISSLPKFSKKIKELIELQSELSLDLQKIEEQTKCNASNLAKLDISKLLLQVESIKDSNHNLKAVIEDIQKGLAQDANKQQAQLDDLQHALKQSHDNDHLQLEYLESQGKSQKNTLSTLQDLDKKSAQQLNTILTKQESLQQELDSKLASLNTAVAEHAKKHNDFNTKLYDLVDKSKSKMQEQLTASAKDIKSTSSEQQQSLVERLNKLQALQESQHEALESRIQTISEQILVLDTKSNAQQKSLLELKDKIIDDLNKSQQEYQTKVDKRLNDLEKTLNEKFYKQSKNMSMNNSLSILIVILMISIWGLLAYKAFV